MVINKKANFRWKFITVVILHRGRVKNFSKTIQLGRDLLVKQRIIERIFFLDESISVTGNLFESDERKVIREIQWSVEFRARTTPAILT